MERRAGCVFPAGAGGEGWRLRDRSGPRRPTAAAQRQSPTGRRLRRRAGLVGRRAPEGAEARLACVGVGSGSLAFAFGAGDSADRASARRRGGHEPRPPAVGVDGAAAFRAELGGTGFGQATVGARLTVDGALRSGGGRLAGVAAARRGQGADPFRPPPGLRPRGVAPGFRRPASRAFARLRASAAALAARRWAVASAGLDVFGGSGLLSPILAMKSVSCRRRARPGPVFVIIGHYRCVDATTTFDGKSIRRPRSAEQRTSVMDRAGEGDARSSGLRRLAPGRRPPRRSRRTAR